MGIDMSSTSSKRYRYLKIKILITRFPIGKRIYSFILKTILYNIFPNIYMDVINASLIDGCIRVKHVNKDLLDSIPA